jgi:hypothetical protein
LQDGTRGFSLVLLGVTLRLRVWDVRWAGIE